VSLSAGVALEGVGNIDTPHICGDFDRQHMVVDGQWNVKLLINDCQPTFCVVVMVLIVL
jgi:hypothetical protein